MRANEAGTASAASSITRSSGAVRALAMVIWCAEGGQGNAWIRVSLGCFHLGSPSLEAKAQVERHVLAAHPGNVVLGPTVFFDMALRPESLAALADGTLVDGLPADLPIPGLGLDDYGRMVNAIIDSPSLHNLPSRRLDLGCDTLTSGSRAQALTALLGRSVTYRPLPLPVVQSIDTYWYSLLQWMIRTGRCHRRSQRSGSGLALHDGLSLRLGQQRSGHRAPS